MNRISIIDKASNRKINYQTCSMCGAISGDAWETEPTRQVLLQLRPRYGDESHFWSICDECSEGLENISLPKPDRIHLLAQIRRATIQDQEAVLKWLLQKFNLKTEKKQ